MFNDFVPVYFAFLERKLDHVWLYLKDKIVVDSFLQILKYTPESHSDYSTTKNAVEQAEELCNQVNEGVRETENSEHLEWLQTHVECEGLAEVRDRTNFFEVFVYLLARRDRRDGYLALWCYRQIN